MAAQAGERGYHIDLGSAPSTGACLRRFAPSRDILLLAGMLLAICLLLFSMLSLPLHAQNAPAGWLVNPNDDDEVVYIDPGGLIRVYDPFGETTIAWVSPEGGWQAAALGDVTGDGDEEIVAIGGKDAAARLVVYDPVVAAGAVNADQQFNGVPWKQLYITNLPATPRLVATGEFDPASPGREIVYVTDAPPDNDGDPRSVITILTQAGGTTDGTAWRMLASATTGQQWSDISTGDLALTGIDHIALIDEDRGVLSVFRLRDGSLQRYYVNASDTREWSSSAIGQVDPATAQPELVLVRRADQPLASLVILRYEPPDSFADVYLRDFNPSPRVVFLADVNANAEAEVFMLRNVTRTAGCPPPYNTPPFQLIMRNRGPDRPTNFEVCLDQANTFRYGAGGDLNGDGKDEVIVLSAVQLRVFYNVDTTFTATNVQVSSDARTIVAGNLDKVGAIKPNTLEASRSRLEFTVKAGERSQSQAIELSNSAPSGEPIPLQIYVLPQVSYVRWSLSSDSTPATLSVYIDAAELLPDIVYAAELLVDSVGVSVTNTPYPIPILIRVDEGMIVQPEGITVVLRSCRDSATKPKVELRVLGTAGITFDATVDSGPAGTEAATQSAAPHPESANAIPWQVNDVPWISSAESPTAVVPSTIVLSIDPLAAAPFNQAHVTVTGQLDGQTYTRTSNVNVVCTENPVYLPVVKRMAWPR
jgi:hypothetical protein